MADFMFDEDGVQQNIGVVAQQLNSAREVLQDLRTKLDPVKQTWIGEGSEAYNAAMEEFFQKVEKLNEDIENYGQQLTKALDMTLDTLRQVDSITAS